MRVGDPLRATIVSRAGGRCEYCHYPEHFSPSAFEVEHIVPISAGGLTEINNLALACSHCNAHKAARRIGLIRIQKLKLDYLTLELITGLSIFS